MSGSHAQWAEGFMKHSTHHVELLSLPGRHWKWRMYGAGPELAHQFMDMEYEPELVLATDLMDLSVFCGLSRNKLKNVSVALYFHENQLCYPWSNRDPDTKSGRNRHYAFINLQSAIAADKVFFSSAYQRTSFLNALPAFLKAFPDQRLKWSVDQIAEKSSVLHLGIELEENSLNGSYRNTVPYIIWNHRWEYDKNPDLFFNTLISLSEEGVSFKLIVTGESYGEAPPIFAVAKEKLAQHIVHWGFASSRKIYLELLKQADIIPVSNEQDFFGISVIEAVWAGAEPLLPERLAYPEIFGDTTSYYQDDGSFVEQLRIKISEHSANEINQKRLERLSKFSWREMIKEWDNSLYNTVYRQIE